MLQYVFSHPIMLLSLTWKCHSMRNANVEFSDWINAKLWTCCIYPFKCADSTDGFESVCGLSCPSTMIKSL